MKTMEIENYRDSYNGALIKWTGLFIFMALFAVGINTMHQQQIQKLKTESEFIKHKSYLVSQMHDEMLLISRAQLQILHASNHQQVKENLLRLSELVSNHLVHYHQLKSMADETDVDLLEQYKFGLDKWYGFNKDLLAYANVVSDSSFINTLNKIDLAFSQFDNDNNEALLLIAQTKQDNSSKGL